MEALLSLLDTLIVNEPFKAFLVEFFNSGSLLADKVLEFEIRVSVLFLSLSYEILHGLQIELALVDL